ncbi:TonB-dependent receptor [Winogradskyella maritima]|uniref:TonB-dependent receptor n=1 Tax=Winogradskyella maritima TaxID=1517766 RepID=A0ABV8AHJ7_9FLAO|nr:TonB-dependent receptor [Winogradskyella maritima]
MDGFRYTYIVFVLFIGCCFQLKAQSLKGTITNTVNQPLETVYVFNASKNTHAHTDENGFFLLEKTEVGDSLRIGLLGYKTINRIVKDSDFNSKVLTIILEEKAFQLEELVLTENIDALNTISRLDLNITPVNSSQDVLRKVPGLFIGQHAGGGKAEQIFLRGFDIDHGTDVSIQVDGMPVNMVSHAHGQGYSDLHFVIPETIKAIEFGKGAYYGKEGDFNTAGYIDFETKDFINESSISVSAGQFNTLRTAGVFDILKDRNNQNAYMALEYIETDGPFESPQNFNRINLFGKYSTFVPGRGKISVTGSHFTSRWDASGQIPQREVDNGNITRFGAIDDTEGGSTQRTNFNLEFSKSVSDKTTFSANAFYSHYEFLLFSNFTFFLEDPENGDQIKQQEDRDIFGFNLNWTSNLHLGNTPLEVTSGVGLRHDIINNVELSRTLNRKTTLEQVQFGDVNQTNANAFVSAEFDFGKFRMIPALRLDYFNFLYEDQLQEAFETQSETQAILSPKLNFFYDVNSNLQLFAKSGLGFHSNDARVVVTNTEKTLPRSYGADLGAVWKPTKNLFINTALWYLFLEQEFVYVGDAGIVEPSGETERFGLDFGLRYQLTDWLFADTDVTLTKARSIEEPDGQDFIPLAPNFTMAGGLSVTDINGFSGGLRYRYLDDRPANEDNSIVAEGYFVIDFNMNYKINKNIQLGVAIENLFDVEWNETQFATESRLQNELTSVEEIHFTPGTPFFIKATATYRF